jgi:hypothetical protein
MNRILLLLAIATLTACVSGRGAAGECNGAIIATVRNNWRQPIDVYARMRETSAYILGEVAPGERREFELPEGATGVYYEWRGPTILRPTSSDIATSYACR